MVPVAVNFSPVQFRCCELPAMVERIIQETGLDPNYIILEITETALMQDVEFTRSILKQFKDLGFCIAIDDFGTGYSSLSYLKKFPIDFLKIDISFIKDITTDPDAAAIVTAIISMAHNLGLRTIAEGVETKEQRQILRLLRCDIIPVAAMSGNSGLYGRTRSQGRFSELPYNKDYYLFDGNLVLFKVSITASHYRPPTSGNPYPWRRCE